MQGSPRRWRGLQVTVIVVALLAGLAAGGSALAASNSLKVKATKTHLVFAGTAVAAGDAVAVYFDPNKCAASYAKEIRRKHVAFTDFLVHKAGQFKFTVKLPIPVPAGGKRAHHACAWLLRISGSKVKPVVSASRKY